MKFMRLILSLCVVASAAMGSEIHDAVAKGDLDKLKKILADNPEASNEVRAGDKRGITPLITALMVYQEVDKKTPEELQQARDKCVKVIDILLKNKANPNACDLVEKHAPLQGAAALGLLDAVKLLVDHGADINQKDNGGMTALMFAISESDLEIVKYLIEKRADIKVRDKSGATALVYAVDWRNAEIIKFLLKQNANIKDITDAKDTVLHVYAKSSRPDHPDVNGEVLKLLLDAGADLAARNADGLTPAEVAEKENSQAMALTLVLAKHKRNSLVGKWSVKADEDRLLQGILATRPKAAAKMSDDDKKKLKDGFQALAACETHEFLAGGVYTWSLVVHKELQGWLRDLANGCEAEDTRKAMQKEIEEIIALSGTKATGAWKNADGAVSWQFKANDDQVWKPRLNVEKGELTVNGFMNRTDVILTSRD